jgi:hypothetical protein
MVVMTKTLSTEGEGRIAGSARGVTQLKGELIAAVNNGSNTVAYTGARGTGSRLTSS